MKEWALGRIAGALSREGSILCFHGIREECGSADGILHVSIARMNELLAVVRGAGAIVPLDELIGRWSAGRTTRGLMAVTFDDAYASLLATADHWYTRAPFPLTIFVVSEASQSGATFWWDRLETLAPLLGSDEWRRIGVVVGLDGAWHVEPVSGSAMGRRVREWVVTRCHGRADSRFRDELSRLEELHGVRTRQRAMTLEELRRFAGLGPVSFGAHTITHASLSTLTPGGVVEEIRAGWEAMGAWGLPGMVPVLAAPYGAMRPDISSLAAQAGMQACLALDDRRVGPLSHKGESPVVSRLSIVQGVSPVRLAYRLSGMREAVAAHSGKTVGQ